MTLPYQEKRELEQAEEQLKAALVKLAERREGDEEVMGALREKLTEVRKRLGRTASPSGRFYSPRIDADDESSLKVADPGALLKYLQRQSEGDSKEVQKGK